MDQNLGLGKDEDDDLGGGKDEIVEVEVEVESLGDKFRRDGERGGANVIADGGDVQQAEGVASGGREGSDEAVEPVAYPHPRHQLTKNPTRRQMPIWDLTKGHGASNLISDISNFLSCRCGVPPHNTVISCHNHVDVWCKVYLHHQPLPFVPFDPLRRDVVRVSPEVLGPGSRIQQRAAWDVALYLEQPNWLCKFLSFLFLGFLSTVGIPGPGSSDERREKHGIQRKLHVPSIINVCANFFSLCRISRWPRTCYFHSP